MFGQFYHRYEDAVLHPGSGEVPSPESYASLALAELLDRAELLAVVWRSTRRPGRSTALSHAVDIFLRDVDEARARGLRAGLFCRTESAALDPWSTDPNDDLRDLGGPLAPAGTSETRVGFRV
jgi:hypothetical protein